VRYISDLLSVRDYIVSGSGGGGGGSGGWSIGGIVLALLGAPWF
jgi:hypothetical protein